ncbi:LIM domain-containing protein E-like [Papaver somniferum]|uniref:LIM domain-containing protein E-like n=1 Tax=Papaver somniferum TaxID=3469 RepID=UPI000E7039D2|nr:LIM domain-containing protein E-like [Papaver somniferum]
MPKKKVDEYCSRSHEPNPPLGQEHQFETPQPSKSSTMTYLRKPDRVKKKRGNDLTPIDHTPTSRGDKHLGVDNREGMEHNDQEEVGVETNREGNENEIFVEEETNYNEDEEEFKETDDDGEEEEESNDE